MKRRASLVAALLLGPTALSGCGAVAGSDTAGTEVVAAFYPLQFVAERVAGPDADVSDLTTPGQEPHDLELSVAGNAEVAEADLVVYEGGLQAAVDAAVEQNATGATLDVTDVVDLVPLAEEHAGENADEHDGEERGDEHDGEQHADEHDGEEHDHAAEGEDGTVDPHFWLDPLLLADVGDAVARDLAQVDPPHADGYTARAAALRTDLESLDEAFESGLRRCERTTVVVSHDAFGYLDRYGLTFEAVAGLSPEAEPTPADLARLQSLIERDGLTTVFSEALVSPRLTAALARDTGVRTAVLDPVEGLTEATAEEDYLSLMRANLSALQAANGCS